MFSISYAAQALHHESIKDNILFGFSRSYTHLLYSNRQPCLSVQLVTYFPTKDEKNSPEKQTNFTTNDISRLEDAVWIRYYQRLYFVHHCHRRA